MANAKQIKGTPVVLVGLGPELLDQISNATMAGMQFVLQHGSLVDMISKLGFGAEAEAPKRSRRK
jgi:hypothetical protein